MKTKQVIVIRKDLNMRKGKACSQAAHVSMRCFFDIMKKNNDEYSFKIDSPAVHNWINGLFTKITVSVNSRS
jgi:peptidyl-tRNA hydrolase, PTH2 family